MTTIGYARTSTADQVAGLDAQKRDLLAAGCEEIFSEHVSSTAEREQLVQALARVQKGDVFVVTKPDRLARGTKNFLDIVEDLDRRGIALVLLSMGGGVVDSRSPTGKLMLTMLGAIAEFERAIMLERQREGISKAREAGRYTGRKPYSGGVIDSVRSLSDDGVFQHEIAKRLNVSIATVSRIVRRSNPLTTQQ